MTTDMPDHSRGMPQQELAAFCLAGQNRTAPPTIRAVLTGHRRNRIRKLALFGSILREDFRSDSDVDVLVEFKRGYPVGLLRMAALERELSELLKRQVDLRTPAELSRYFRDEVLRTSEVQYVEG